MRSRQMPGARSQRASPALIALLISSVLGFHLGSTRFADWQIPVESGQVLAGIVNYPVATPFYVHHLKLWTLFLMGVPFTDGAVGLSPIVLIAACAGCGLVVASRKPVTDD
jgi:hypothetical protein